MKRISCAARWAPLPLLWMTSAFGQTESSASSTLETITVTGNMEADRAAVDRTPGGASLIDMEDFRERNVSSLADVLRYVPGVWAVSDFGNDDMFFSSRGSNLDATDWDMNGIKLLQDGLPVTTADGNNHNRIIDPLAARYATVARGANAMSYGASTLGGAINFVTPTARDSESVDLALNAGSHGQMLGRLSLARVLTESFDGLLTVEAKQWDGYREHNEQKRAGLYANAGWQPTADIATRFYATYLTNDQELPGSLSRAEMDADPNQASTAALAGDYQIDVDTWRLANRTSWQIDEDRKLEFGLSLEQQKLFHPIVWVAVDFDGPGPQPETEVFSLLVDSEQRDAGAMVRYGQQIGDHEVLLGLNYGNNDVEGGDYRNLHGTANGLTTIVGNDAATTELFAMDRWQLDDRTTLILAAQAVSAERAVSNTDAASGVLTHLKDTYERVNPSAGLIRAVGKRASFYGNVSRLFEPPTNFELEDNVAGSNATLAAMRGAVVELGTRGESSFASATWLWDVSLYYAQIDDEILSVDDPSAPGVSLVTNVDRTTHAGLEAMVSSEFMLAGSGRSLAPLLSLTVNEFTFDGDATYADNELPAAPAYFMRAELLYRVASGFHVGPTIEVVGERWADFANTYRIDSYSVVGLRAGWTGDRWSAFAELRNLEDEDYVASHSARNLALPGDRILNPGEPRSAYFGVQVQLD
jgi:iron complex outermembrane receptor protein